MERVLGAVARFRDRMRYSWPQNWALTAVAAGLALLGWLMADADGPAISATLASLWLTVGGLALLTVSGRAAFQGAFVLYIVGGAFVLVLLIGLYQLTPGGPGLAHPMWQLVDAPGAITLNRDATSRELLKLTALGAVFLAGMVIGRNDRRARLLYRLLLTGGAALAALETMRVLGGAAGGHVPADAKALFFALIVLLALTRMGQAIRESLERPTPGLHTLRILATPVLVFVLGGAMVFVHASNATLALGTAAVFAAIGWELYPFRARSPVIMALMAGAGVAGATALVVFGFVIGPTLAAQSAVEGGRAAALAAHAGAIGDAWVLGYGLGCFGEINNLLQTAQNWRALAPMQTAQSLYMQWMLEAGALASIAMVAALAALMVLLVQGALRRKRLRSWLRASVVISGFILVQGVYSDGLQTYATPLLWTLLLGLGAGLATAGQATTTRTT